MRLQGVPEKMGSRFNAASYFPLCILCGLWIVWILLVTPGPNHKPFKHNHSATLDQSRECYFSFNSFRQQVGILLPPKIVFSSFRNVKSLLYGTEHSVNNVQMYTFSCGK